MQISIFQCKFKHLNRPDKLISASLMALVITGSVCWGANVNGSSAKVFVKQKPITSKVIPKPSGISKPGRVVDPITLAEAISTVTNRPTIFVLQDEEQITSVIKKTWPSGDFQMKQLPSILNEVGATNYVSRSNENQVIQGRPYISSSPSTGEEIQARDNWRVFVNGYNQLSKQLQQDLLTKEGITFPYTLEGCPEPWKDMIAPEIIVKPTPKQLAAGIFRIRVRLAPGLIMGFPSPPTGLHRGWWTYSYFPDNRPISLSPMVAASSKFHDLSSCKLMQSDKYIDANHLIALVRREIGWKVRISSDVIMPKLVVAGGGVTVASLLDCLVESASVDVRVFGAQKLIFITKPVAVDDLLGKTWLTASEFSFYRDILLKSAEAQHDDLGPLANGMFLLPLRSLPDTARSRIFSSPYSWDGPSDYPHNQVDIDKRLGKWNAQYGESDALLLPAIDLCVSVEDKIDPDKWFADSNFPIRFDAVSR